MPGVINDNKRNRLDISRNEGLATDWQGFQLRFWALLEMSITALSVLCILLFTDYTE